MAPMTPPIQPGTTAYQGTDVPSITNLDGYLGLRTHVYDQVAGTKDITELRFVKNGAAAAIDPSKALIISADGTEVTGETTAAAYNTVLADPQLIQNGVTSIAVGDYFYVVGYGYAYMTGAIAAGTQIAAAASGATAARGAATDEQVIGESRGTNDDSENICYVYRCK